MAGRALRVWRVCDPDCVCYYLYIEGCAAQRAMTSVTDLPLSVMVLVPQLCGGERVSGGALRGWSDVP
jgi:hypothetical protein